MSRRRPPKSNVIPSKKHNPFAKHPGLPTTSVSLITSNNPAPVNSFLATLTQPDPLPNTVDLSFKAGQSVGIHFRWANGLYVVVGFTENSPARVQGKVESGCTLLAVNKVALSGLQQKVVNNMMKEFANKDRILSFTSPPVPPYLPTALAKRPPKAPAQVPAAATAQPPPTLPWRKSSDKDITTPARRMRIIYEFTKVLVIKRMIPDGIQAGITMKRKIAAANVIQAAIRAFLARKFFTAAMKLRKYIAAVKIQKRARMVLSKYELWRRRRAREVKRRNRGAMKGKMRRPVLGTPPGSSGK